MDAKARDEFIRTPPGRGDGPGGRRTVPATRGPRQCVRMRKPPGQPGRGGGCRHGSADARSAAVARGRDRRSIRPANRHDDQPAAGGRSLRRNLRPGSGDSGTILVGRNRRRGRFTSRRDDRSRTPIRARPTRHRDPRLHAGTRTTCRRNRQPGPSNARQFGRRQLDAGQLDAGQLDAGQLDAGQLNTG
ncbi:hypothetical protein GCM10009558_062380 [Virgisporangium aurantiacum]